MTRKEEEELLAAQAIARAAEPGTTYPGNEPVVPISITTASKAITANISPTASVAPQVDVAAHQASVLAGFAKEDATLGISSEISRSERQIRLGEKMPTIVKPKSSMETRAETRAAMRSTVAVPNDVNFDMLKRSHRTVSSPAPGA